MKVIFILGTGHCGSTLLDLIFDSHDQITGLGEIENFKQEKICSCGKQINKCSFWNKILINNVFFSFKIYRKKIDFLLNRDKYYLKSHGKSFLLNKEDKKRFLQENYLIYKKSLSVSKSNIIVDSSKNVNRVELLSEYSKIQPIIIHLVRDGRGVIWSYMKKYNSFLPFVWKWFIENVKIEIIRRRNKFKYIFVNYEKFVKNPEKELKNILNKIDLNYEENMLDFTKFEHHQIGGNRMRFSQSSEIKEDTEWKSKMPILYKFLFFLSFGWINWYYKKQ